LVEPKKKNGKVVIAQRLLNKNDWESTLLAMEMIQENEGLLEELRSENTVKKS